MADLEYCKSKKISLRNYHDEKWLQDKIEKDPSILGLGDVNIIERERKQSTGGRIDFLFSDPEIDTMYETEIMLGSTDESHIIRTIEYWDIERRRYQSKDHKAVIVAEDITNRFFNVISLMNRSIPIIAIQLNALEVGNKLALNFTKVLDIYEPPEDEEALGGEVVDRAYWEKKSNRKSIAIMDNIIDIVKKEYDGTRITYNKYHVAVGTRRRNIISLHPRKREGYCHMEIKVGSDNIDDIKNKLEEIGISFSPRKKDKFAIIMLEDDVEQHTEQIKEIIKKALVSYS